MWHIVEKSATNSTANTPPKTDPMAEAVDSLWCSKDDLVKSEDFLMAEVFLGGSSERKAKKKKLKSKDGKRFKSSSSSRFDGGDRTFKTAVNGDKMKRKSVRVKTRLSGGGSKAKSYSERGSTTDTKEELDADFMEAESGSRERKKTSTRRKEVTKKEKKEKEEEETEVPVVPDPNCANPEAMVSKK
jgi:hypothetical protein